jgi:hypothetical protein
MRYVFKMEAIGDGFAAYLRHYNKTNPPRFGKRELDAIRFGRKEMQPWIARIKGLHPKFEFDREFIESQRDYTGSSSTGNRGIWLYYALKPGIYEINQRYTWKRYERYFARVIDDNTLERISKQEVLNCFKSESSESTS